MTDDILGFDGSYDDDDDHRFGAARAAAGPAGRLAALAAPPKPTAAGSTRRPSTRPPAPRTAAQREASRRNGARSRGPKTAAGKAKSRLNSYRHGLVARVVCPPADVRGDDALYRRVRGELMAEFKPATFTERALVDGLAHDFVQAARIRRMVDAVQRPPSDPGDAEQWLTLRDGRRDLGAADRLLEAWGVNKAPPASDPKVAARLAARVVEWATRVRDDLAAADAERATEAEASDDPDATVEGDGDASAADVAAVAKWEAAEAAEVDRLRALWADVRPAEHLLTDRGRVAAVLAGRQKVAVGEAKGLRRTVAEVAAGLKRWVEARADLAGRLERARDQAEAALADDPARLLVLQRYLARVELAVDRKVKRRGRG
jgi:hypothetical protein